MKRIIIHNPSDETLDFLKQEAERYNIDLYKASQRPGVRVNDVIESFMTLEVVEDVEIKFP